ncbi:hypothetical protein CC2G_005204 [Coprinopsis cinerea AmutBmut pab1-1]|nr:hypothetical protein CC2G_005204 [Coprinopsis cinerea AmutBmut pab1-1]
MNRPSTLLPASSSSKSTSASRPRTPTQQKFSTFTTTVLTRAEITTPTLLLALIYIHRARPYLHIALEEWALERVFLGALIVASKYANDSTLKNVHWALCTGVFGKRDVGRIEREFLAVLEWDLGVTESEVLGLWEGLEWAVEEKEREEREKRAKLEREKMRQLELLERQREQQQRQQQKSASKFFLGERSSRQPSPPPLPVKPRNHRRSHLAVDALALPSSRTHGHSPSSSSMSSSSSSSSDSPSPTTPEDFQTQYIVIQDGEADHSSPRGVPVVTPPKKRGFTATTMELLKSFPFPGHHHHSHQQLPTAKRHDREFSQPHPYAYTLPDYPQHIKHGRYATEGSHRSVKRLPLRVVSS